MLFEFLKPWEQVFDSALKVELSAISDPRTACFYARRTTEIVVEMFYKILFVVLLQNGWFIML